MLPNDFETQHPSSRRAIAIAGSTSRTWERVLFFSLIFYTYAWIVRDSQFSLTLRIVSIFVTLIFAYRLFRNTETLALPIRRVAQATSALVISAGLLVFHLPRTAFMGHAFASIACATSAMLACILCVSMQGLGGIYKPTKNTFRSIKIAAILLGFAWFMQGIALVSIQRNTKILGFQMNDSQHALATSVIIISSLLVCMTAAIHKRFELGILERYKLAIGTMALLIAIVFALGDTHLAVKNAFKNTQNIFYVSSLSWATGILVGYLVLKQVQALRVLMQLSIGVVFLVGLFRIAVPFSIRYGVMAAFGVSLFGLILSFVFARSILRSRRSIFAQNAFVKAQNALCFTNFIDFERELLASLRLFVNNKNSQPKIIGFMPFRETSLDLVGDAYVQESTQTIPITQEIQKVLFALFEQEPLGFVRRETLKALEVYRSDLRMLLSWFDEQQISIAIGFGDANAIEGIVLVGQPRKPSLMSLEQAYALRSIANLATARLTVEYALLRANRYTNQSQIELHQCKEQLASLLQRETQARAGLSIAASIFAKQISIGGYAPKARALRHEIESIAQTQTHQILIHRPGIDPTPYAALLHQQSNCLGAFYRIDASECNSWSEPDWLQSTTTPWTIANQGTLLILNGQSLSKYAQNQFVRILKQLATHEKTQENLSCSVRFILSLCTKETLTSSPSNIERVVAFHLHPELIEQFYFPVLRIPALAERCEDIHALVFEQLAKLGSTIQGQPLGITDEAMALLMEYDWPGDDLELEAVLTVAAMQTTSLRLEHKEIAAALQAKK